MYTNLVIKESVHVYEEVVHKLCELFTKLKIDKDPVKVYETFLYMFRNGYLSSNGTYSAVLPEDIENLELNGFIPMDITGLILLYGCGCCRHTTDFLSHIFHSLRFEEAQLFTYHPGLSINVDCYTEKLIIYSEIQKYIDETIVDLDLFSKEEIHFTKDYGDIVVHVDYLPEKVSNLNHTMNIVLDNNERAHILDTRYHCVGERINQDSIRLSYQGLNHIDFIQRDIRFHTYYGTNYNRGIGLLNYDTNIGMDMLTCSLGEKFCEDNIKEFEKFQQKNKKSYDKVTDNINMLVKKL